MVSIIQVSCNNIPLWIAVYQPVGLTGGDNMSFMEQ